VLHALIGERRDHHFGAGHFFRHRPLHTQPLSRNPGIKKGPKSPCPRTAVSKMASATPGDAPPYDYQYGNIIAHVSRLSAFPCAAIYGPAALRSSGNGPS